MAEERLPRRLAAILSADVVGYSRLMGIDEAGTLSRLNALRRDLIDPTIATHSGRIVKLMGDGALVEFASAVDAVTCALEIQKQLRERANDKADPIQFRIGINVGDIIIEGNDILGDGVNIAARIEGIAEPGGISISEDAFRQVQGKVAAKFLDTGEQNLKNIGRPTRVYRVEIDGAPELPRTGQPLSIPDEPSIAVLPFTNMSGDTQQEYFADGISEDIITDLSRIAGLMVISRNSSFTYKGRSVDVRTVGRDLGVRSVLEGSVRRVGDRVRITAQLTDAGSGRHLWADRYDRELTDLFAVQDDVTRRIVAALKVNLTPTEKSRLSESSNCNIEAYDFYLRGRVFLWGENKNRKTFEQSVGLLKTAVELDRDYSQAYAGLAWAYIFDYFNRWSDNPDSSLQVAKNYAETAVGKDPNEPLARCIAALVAILDRDLNRARSEVDVALTLNPNFAFGYNTLGSIYTYLGRPLDAIDTIERAMRLDPAWVQQYLHFLGTANLLAGKYDRAAALLRQRVLLVPSTDFSRAVLASALGHLGQVDEARRVWRELMEINPRYSFKEHFGRQPFRPEDVERVAQGLARAGLPN